MREIERIILQEIYDAPWCACPSYFAQWSFRKGKYETGQNHGWQYILKGDSWVYFMKGKKSR